MCGPSGHRMLSWCFFQQSFTSYRQQRKLLVYRRDILQYVCQISEIISEIHFPYFFKCCNLQNVWAKCHHIWVFVFISIFTKKLYFFKWQNKVYFFPAGYSRQLVSHVNKQTSLVQLVDNGSLGLASYKKTDRQHSVSKYEDNKVYCKW